MAAVRGAMFGLLLLMGCGDPIVDGSYGGETKLLLRGKIDDARPSLDLRTDVVRVGLFWHPRGVAPVGSFTELIEQPSNGRDVKYPGGFNWSLFEEPEPAHFFTAPSGARYAFGEPLAYLDANANLRWDPDEPLLADAPTSGVLFTKLPLGAGDSPTGRSVNPGYYVMMRPRECSQPPSSSTADGDCDVPIGEPCDVDTDCNGGVCLSDGPWPWPGGYCAIPEPPPNGCRPRNAVLFMAGQGSPRSWWVKACQSPSDCTRGFPYQCELLWAACLPSAHVLMVGSRDVRPRPYCAEDMPPDGGMGPSPF